MFGRMIWRVVQGSVPARSKASIAARLIRSLDGADRRQVQRWLSIASLDSTCEQLVAQGVRVEDVVDVGAQKGNWTRVIKRFFPAARVVMVEADRSNEGDLAAVEEQWPGSVWRAMELVGERARPGVPFHLSESGSSVLRDVSGAAARRVFLDMRTLDDVVRESPLESVDLLKIDAQGYELKILEGARNLLEDVELVLLEVSMIRLYEGCPLLSHVVAFMASRGFRAYDITEFHLRPLDGAMAQVDILFARDDSRLVGTEGWN